MTNSYSEVAYLTKKEPSFLHDRKYVIRVMIPHAGTLKLHKLSVATEGPSLQLLGENH